MAVRTVAIGPSRCHLGGVDPAKPAPAGVPLPLSERRKEALARLLADEDQIVFRAVRREIVSHGPSVRPWLAGFSLHADPVLRRRALAIVEHFDRLDADIAFNVFCLRHGEELNLEEGCWLLSRSRFPSINVEAYRAMLDGYAADLMGRLDYAGEPESIIATLNACLFAEQGFRGNEEEYYSPDNSYLSRVLDLRTGNPILLCVLYLTLCRRLQLPVAGIGLPGHFLCRFQNARTELFIDAFNKGRLLTKADCVKYLRQAGYEFHEAFLVPASPRRILLRICSNLHQIHQHQGDKAEAERLQGYILALSK